jgi:hypothetical protein
MNHSSGLRTCIVAQYVEAMLLHPWLKKHSFCCRSHAAEGLQVALHPDHPPTLLNCSLQFLQCQISPLRPSVEGQNLRHWYILQWHLSQFQLKEMQLSISMMWQCIGYMSTIFFNIFTATWMVEGWYS